MLDKIIDTITLARNKRFIPDLNEDAECNEACNRKKWLIVLIYHQ